MKTGSAITIVQSANGYIVYEQEDVKLPADPKVIATFTQKGGMYDTNGMICFIDTHFARLSEKTDGE